MICPVCDSTATHPRARISPYADFDVSVYDCSACGCRFAERTAGAHASLHEAEGSSYGSHRREAAEVAELLKRGDVTRVENRLRGQSKFRFILDQLERRPGTQRVLELGCSTGSFTACLNAKGHAVTGADLSESSLHIARSAFGDHFVKAGSVALNDRGPFDVICHAGTIGCVERPVDFTRELLAMLQPGGALLFNAPDLAFAEAAGLDWLVTTPPPDLVTLFPEQFWHDHFANESIRVHTQTQYIGEGQFYKLRYTPDHWVRGRTQLFKRPRRLESLAWALGYYAYAVGFQAFALARGKIGKIYPSEYGVMVRMEKHNAGEAIAAP